MVMCNIRAKPCSIHMCRLIFHPYWLSHVSHELFCMLRMWCLHECGICMYWNHFMHVHDTHWRPARACTYPKLAMFVHVSARIKR
jgi:hypothetical protein